MMSHHILEMRNMRKSYSSVVVLSDVTIAIGEGEIVGLIGENGAGKSTLMKILSGGTQPDAGEIIMDGKKIEIASPIVASQQRIAMVQQELSLIPSLTVQDNIVLGREFRTGPLRMLNSRRNREYSLAAMKTVDLDVPLDVRVGKLSVANQQMLEIARNLIRAPRVLILDEPTTALTLVEAEALLAQMEVLKSRGTSIIFISHKLEEIMRVSDRMIVMRDGAKVGEVKKNEVTRDDLVKMMVGDKQFFSRETSRRYVDAKSARIFTACNLRRREVFENISFDLRAGEVLGFFGLKGAGRSELFTAIFGADHIDSGEMILDGRPVRFQSPEEAIKAGLGLVTEDRKFSGIFPDMDIKNNIAMSNMKSVSGRFGTIKKERITSISSSYVKKLGVKTTSNEQKIRNLSGGNQQKVLISRWLHSNSKVLVLDEPTKGVDIGAKQDIYEQINEFSREGKGVVVISSELEEVMLLSDRVAVMREGRIQAILDGDDINAETIMHYAAG
ncbi:MAG: sugar ABC transporter ATP-binding protein [Planctomycetaceae bacterium]|nr:sugar ABC transporter ATP-binding protein [Planctomycetaceae bacterium]